MKVIVGPFARIEEALARDIAESRGPLAARGPRDSAEFASRIAVVAPSSRLSFRLERLLAVERGLTLLNVEFHTFHSLARTIIGAAGVLEDRQVVADGLFFQRAIESILDGRPDIARFFGGAKRPRGFLSALAASLKDLADAGVGAEAFEELLPEHRGAGDEERSRLKALSRLLDALSSRLDAAGVLSGSDLARSAAELAPDSRALRRFSRVLYYGFYDLTGRQLDFFESVASARPTTLYFPYEIRHPAYRFAEPLFEERLARHEVEESPEREARPAAAVSIVNASGERGEVWAAAKEILRLREEEGVPFESIGVVARALAPYHDEIQSCFSENAIPFAMEERPALTSHPAARTARALLTLRRRDFKADVVAELLGSPYIQAPSALGGRRRSWRRALRRLGVHSGLSQWQGKLQTPPEGSLSPWEPDPEERRALNAWLERLDRSLEDRSAAWPEHAQRAAAILEDAWRLPDDAKEEEAAVFAAVRDAIASLGSFSVLGEVVSWETFLDYLEQKFDGAALPSTKPGRGVRVLDAMDARGECFDVLFLLGLKSGLFPRQVREDPILRDSWRGFLRHPGGFWISRKLDGVAEERLLFHLLVSSAKIKLYAVYPRTAEDGAVEVPSPYLRLLSPVEERRIPRSPLEKLRSAPPALLSPQEWCLKLALEGGASLEALRSFDPSEEVLPFALSRLASLNSWDDLGPFDGVTGPTNQGERPLSSRLSVKALVTLDACPFRFFAERSLGISPADEPAPRSAITPALQGRLYAEVLERLHQSLPRHAWDHIESEGPAYVESAIAEIFKRYDARNLGVYPLVWEAFRDRAVAALRNFAAWDLRELTRMGLRPVFWEREIEGTCPDPPRGLKGLRLYGRVDRASKEREGGLYVLDDYKMRRPRTGSSHERGALFQLGLYREILAQAPETGAVPRARLLFIEADGEEGEKERSKEHPLSREEFRRRLAPALDRLARGLFPIFPQEGFGGHCGWCPHSLLCRKDHRWTRVRADHYWQGQARGDS
jgi:ATP-dependent helicase/DNAse subunit B